jgi:group I intron endonuclease
MPYAQRQCGVYRLLNAAANVAYIGSSINVQKRRAEHFRLLRKNEHPNYNLQRAYNAYGPDSFICHYEVICDDIEDARQIELAVLKKELQFDNDDLYNIAFDKYPMLGRNHSTHTKQKIAQTKQKNAAAISKQTQQKLSAVQRARRLASSEHRRKIEYIVGNAHLSYAERARSVGITASNARKLFLRYAPLYGVTPPASRPSYARDVQDKIEYIRNNPNKPYTEIARYFGVSSATIGRLARHYKLR